MFLLLETGNKSVTQSLDAGLKLGSVLRPPVSTVLSGDSGRAGEANVEDILGIVSVISRETLVGEAEVGKAKRSLTSRGETVCVAPHTVEL